MRGPKVRNTNTCAWRHMRAVRISCTQLGALQRPVDRHAYSTAQAATQET